MTEETIYRVVTRGWSPGTAATKYRAWARTETARCGYRSVLAEFLHELADALEGNNGKEEEK